MPILARSAISRSEAKNCGFPSAKSAVQLAMTATCPVRRRVDHVQEHQTIVEPSPMTPRVRLFSHRLVVDRV